MRNYKSVDWSLFKDTTKTSQFNRCINSKEDIEKEVGKLYKVINKGLDRACPLKPSRIRNSHVWWNDECEQAKRVNKRLSQELNKAGNNNVELWDAWKTSNKDYKKIIKESKQKSWEKFMQETEGMQETSRLVKILRKDKSFNQIPLMRNKQGLITNSYTESICNLMADHFPDSSVNPVNHNLEPGNANLCHSEDTSWITEDKVYQAISKFSPLKGAGLDNIKPIVLKNLPHNCILQLVKIYKGCITYGYTPKRWRQNRVIFIAKPNKEDKSDTRAYQPILLLSYLLKLMEKIVLYHIEESYLTTNPLNRTQYGFVKGKLTENAASILVSELEK